MLQIAFLRHKLLTTYVDCLTVSYAFDAVLALDVLIKFNMVRRASSVTYQ